MKTKTKNEISIGCGALSGRQKLWVNAGWDDKTFSGYLNLLISRKFAWWANPYSINNENSIAFRNEAAIHPQDAQLLQYFSPRCTAGLMVQPNKYIWTAYSGLNLCCSSPTEVKWSGHTKLDFTTRFVANGTAAYISIPRCYGKMTTLQSCILCKARPNSKRNECLMTRKRLHKTDQTQRTYSHWTATWTGSSVIARHTARQRWRIDNRSTRDHNTVFRRDRVSEVRCASGDSLRTAWQIETSFQKDSLRPIGKRSPAPPPHGPPLRAVLTSSFNSTSFNLQVCLQQIQYTQAQESTTINNQTKNYNKHLRGIESIFCLLHVLGCFSFVHFTQGNLHDTRERWNCICLSLTKLAITLSPTDAQCIFQQLVTITPT